MVRLNLKYNRMVELRQRMSLPNLVTLLVTNNRFCPFKIVEIPRLLSKSPYQN